MSTESKHTPTPLAFRISANGRDFEITAPTLRPEWIGSDMQSQPVVIAKVWCGDWTDATGSARALNEANASFIVEACNGYAALQSQLQAERQFKADALEKQCRAESQNAELVKVLGDVVSADAVERNEFNEWVSTRAGGRYRDAIAAALAKVQP